MGRAGSRESRALGSRAGVEGVGRAGRRAGVGWGRESGVGSALGAGVGSREDSRESEKYFAIRMPSPPRVAENTIRGSGSTPPRLAAEQLVPRRSPPRAAEPVRVAGPVCGGLAAFGSSDPGSPQKRLSRLSSAPSGGVPVRLWLSMRWDAFGVRPAERSPGVGSSVGCIFFSMPKHGG